MNDELLKNRKVFPYSESGDSAMIKMLIKGYTTYRLLGAKACKILPDKKYSQIYIEDGINNENGFYNGIIIINNKEVCEITTSQYKLNVDSLSYTKVNNGNFVLYTKRVSMEDFKKKYIDEYFRYELALQHKVKDIEKCLNIDKYTPRSLISFKSYYFSDNQIKKFHIPFEYDLTFKKNGIDYIPDLKEDKKKQFTNCINSLNIQIR